MTPEEKQERVAQIAERASTATKGPWQVHYMETTHRLDSPICKETCGKGNLPIRLEHSSQKEAARYRGITEMHVNQDLDLVVDIIADDDSHVFCTGHDYDEAGVVAPNDAEFIAHARADIDFLLSLVKEQEAGHLSSSISESVVMVSEPSMIECAVCAGRFPRSDTLVVKNAGGRPERTCADCAKGKPVVPLDATEWPEQLTIIRYNDGGFSATQATPPHGAMFTRVYHRDSATAMRSACVEKVKAYLTDSRDEERGIIEAIASELESFSIEKASTTGEP